MKRSPGWVISFVLVAAMVGLSSTSVLAASPTNVTGGPLPIYTEKDPLTPAQRLIARHKLAVAQQEIARPGYTGGGARTATLCPFAVVSPSLINPAGSFCAGWYGYVATRPVEQERSYWCGVATVQVVSNYAWGMPPGTNKYTQTHISNTWTHTGTYGTSTTAEIRGLNGAVGVQLPPGFVYSGVWHNGKLTGPLSGAEWHGYLRTDLSQLYKMPQVVSVSPMDPRLAFGLATWSAVGAPKQYAGHWIVIYGWDLIWDGTTNPKVAYDDSGILHTGGVTGRDPALYVYTMIKQYNPNHGTNGVVW